MLDYFITEQLSVFLRKQPFRSKLSNFELVHFHNIVEYNSNDFISQVLIP